MFTVELRYAAATLSPRSNRDSRRWEAAVRWQAPAIASAFAGYSGLNRFTLHRFNKPAVSLAARRLERGS